MMCQLFSSAIRCTSLSVLLSLFAVAANAQAIIVPPGAPTIVSVTPGYAKVLITVAAPLSDGGSVITGYTANCLNVTGNDIRKFISGGTGNSATSSIITGPVRFAPYACSVRAFNIAGTGPVSPEVNASSSQFPLNGLASATNAAPYGGPLTLTASFVDNFETGTVSFSVVTGDTPVVLAGCSAVPLVAGYASCNAAGRFQNQSPREYQANYSGDTKNESTKLRLEQTVALNSAVLNVSANPLQPVVSGSAAVLTALIKMKTPVGNVTFYDNGVPIPGCEQKPVSLLTDAVDSAVVNCTVTVPSVPSGVKRYVATYFYPTGHESSRVFEQQNFDLRVVAHGPQDYTGMWWAGSTESGWGMSVTQHGPTQFNVIFAYDNIGKSLWYVMPGGSFNAVGTVFTGSLYLPTSSPFSAYDKSKFVIGASVGTATIAYAANGTATLAYTINGISATKSIQKQLLAPLPTGPATNTTQSLLTNDLWWGTSTEDGWGINIAQQGRALFPVWYTYDDAGKATFFTAQGGSWQGTVWTGTIYSHTSSPWLGVTFNAALSRATSVGTMSLDFSDAGNAMMTTTVNDKTQARRIERQAY